MRFFRNCGIGKFFGGVIPSKAIFSNKGFSKILKKEFPFKIPKKKLKKTFCVIVVLKNSRKLCYKILVLKNTKNCVLKILVLNFFLNGDKNTKKIC